MAPSSFTSCLRFSFSTKWIGLSVFFFMTLVMTADGTAKVFIKFTDFKNPSSLKSDGQCCDGEIDSNNACTGACDYYIDVCIGRSPSSPCSYTSEDLGYINADGPSIEFPATFLDGHANPVPFDIRTWPGSVFVTINIVDQDISGRESVDTLQVNFTMPSPTRNSGQLSNYQAFDLIGTRSVQPTRMSLSVTARCDRFFYGDACDVKCLPADDCSGHYTCDKIDGHKICLDGWGGESCGVPISNNHGCSNDKCSNHGTCNSYGNRTDQFYCCCDDGFQGDTCNKDIDECAAFPCQHGGLCSQLAPPGFMCQCGSRHKGDLCQDGVTCDDNPCQNGGRCISLKDLPQETFYCACDYQIATGDLCENLVTTQPTSPPTTKRPTTLPTTTSPTTTEPTTVPSTATTIPASSQTPNSLYPINKCFGNYHGANCTVYCVPTNDCSGHYTCDRNTGGKLCFSGWSGPNCNTPDVRSPDCRCQNGGYCFRSSCCCGYSFQGDACEIEDSPCANANCRNGGTCFLIAGEAVCNCRGGFVGARCDVMLYANRNCRQGYYGPSCEVFCQPRLGCGDAQYSCDEITGRKICGFGYMGDNCDRRDPNAKHTMPCPDSFCRNGGQCNNGTCCCLPGFTGTLCQRQILKCHSSPCLNGGRCQNLIGGYSCTCAPGFTGLNCEYFVYMSNPSVVLPTTSPLPNVCDSTPCGLRGQCIQDGTNGYICICNDRFVGDKCQKYLPKVDSGDKCPPFIYGRDCSVRCLEQDNCAGHFYCDAETGHKICRSGWGGSDCDERTLPSRLDPTCPGDGTSCLHNGQCFQNSCCCDVSHRGSHCQEEILPCESMPCGGYGDCEDTKNGFHCDCYTGYDGNRCQHFIGIFGRETTRPSPLPTTSSTAITTVTPIKEYPSNTTQITPIINEKCDGFYCYNGGRCFFTTIKSICKCPYPNMGRYCERLPEAPPTLSVTPTNSASTSSHLSTSSTGKSTLFLKSETPTDSTIIIIGASTLSVELSPTPSTLSPIQMDVFTTAEHSSLQDAIGSPTLGPLTQIPNVPASTATMHSSIIPVIFPQGSDSVAPTSMINSISSSMTSEPLPDTSVKSSGVQSTPRLESSSVDNRGLSMPVIIPNISVEPGFKFSTQVDTASTTPVSSPDSSFGPAGVPSVSEFKFLPGSYSASSTPVYSDGISPSSVFDYIFLSSKESPVDLFTPIRPIDLPFVSDFESNSAKGSSDALLTTITEHSSQVDILSSTSDLGLFSGSSMSTTHLTSASPSTSVVSVATNSPTKTATPVILPPNIGQASTMLSVADSSIPLRSEISSTTNTLSSFSPVHDSSSPGILPQYSNLGSALSSETLLATEPSLSPNIYVSNSVDPIVDFASVYPSLYSSAPPVTDVSSTFTPPLEPASSIHKPPGTAGIETHELSSVTSLSEKMTQSISPTLSVSREMSTSYITPTTITFPDGASTHTTTETPTPLQGVVYIGNITNGTDNTTLIKVITDVLNETYPNSSCCFTVELDRNNTLVDKDGNPITKVKYVFTPSPNDTSSRPIRNQTDILTEIDDFLAKITPSEKDHGRVHYGDVYRKSDLFRLSLVGDIFPETYDQIGDVIAAEWKERNPDCKCTFTVLILSNQGYVGRYGTRVTQLTYVVLSDDNEDQDISSIQTPGMLTLSRDLDQKLTFTATYLKDDLVAYNNSYELPLDRRVTLTSPEGLDALKEIKARWEDYLVAVGTCFPGSPCKIRISPLKPEIHYDRNGNVLTSIRYFAFVDDQLKTPASFPGPSLGSFGKNATSCLCQHTPVHSIDANGDVDLATAQIIADKAVELGSGGGRVIEKRFGYDSSGQMVSRIFHMPRDYNSQLASHFKLQERLREMDIAALPRGSPVQRQYSVALLGKVTLNNTKDIVQRLKRSWVLENSDVTNDFIYIKPEDIEIQSMAFDSESFISEKGDPVSIVSYVVSIDDVDSDYTVAQAPDNTKLSAAFETMDGVRFCNCRYSTRHGIKIRGNMDPLNSTHVDYVNDALTSAWRHANPDYKGDVNVTIHRISPNDSTVGDETADRTVHYVIWLPGTVPGFSDRDLTPPTKQTINANFQGGYPLVSVIETDPSESGSPNEEDDDDDDDDDFPWYIPVGVILAILLIIVVIVVVCCILRDSRRKKSKTIDNDPSMYMESNFDKEHFASQPVVACENSALYDIHSNGHTAVYEVNPLEVEGKSDL